MYKMRILYYLSAILLISNLWSLCDDETACNFGEEEDCEYAEENYDCDGNCEVPTDCNEVCGGEAIVDACNNCMSPEEACTVYAFLPDTVAFIENDTIFIPLMVNGLENLEGIEINIQYTDTVLSLIGVSFAGTDLEDAGFLPQINLDTSGEIHMLGYASEDLFTGSGVILMLTFELIGDVLEYSPFNFIQFEVNNVDMLPNTSNGQVTIHQLGCTDPESCTFDGNATWNDSSCEYPDCAGECGGMSVWDDLPDDMQNCCLPEELIMYYQDHDGDGLGISGGEGANICRLISVPFGWVSNDLDVDDYCYANWYDCNGDCDGTAEPDECGVCSGGASDHDINSDKDECGVCFGQGVQNYYPDYDGDGFGSDDAEAYCPDEVPDGWVDNDDDPNPYCPEDGSCGTNLMGIWNLLYTNDYENPMCVGEGMFNNAFGQVQIEFSLSTGVYQIEVSTADSVLATGVWFMMNENQFCMLMEEDPDFIIGSNMGGDMSGGDMGIGDAQEFEEDREEHCAEIQLEDDILILTMPEIETCSQLYLTQSDNVFPQPDIVNVQDMPLDQGGYVQIFFNGSVYDSPAYNYHIDYYSIWREVGEGECESAGGGYWEFIGEIPTPGPEDQYAFTAPTVCISTNENTYYTIYQVIAHTTNDNSFFSSDLMAGSSTDDLAPQAPTAIHLSGDEENVAFTLSWSPNVETDFKQYTLYRKTGVGTSLDQISTLYDTVYTDSAIERDITYHYCVSAVDVHGNEGLISDEVSGTINTKLDNSSPIPLEFALKPAYPNPFNPLTTISFSLPYLSDIQLSIYSLDGQLIKRIINTPITAGYHQFVWDAKNQSSGVYLIQLSTNSYIATEKVLLIK